MGTSLRLSRYNSWLLAGSLIRYINRFPHVLPQFRVETVFRDARNSLPNGLPAYRLGNDQAYLSRIRQRGKQAGLGILCVAFRGW